MKSTVLHLCSSAGLFGAESVILALAREMQQSEWNPVVGVMRNRHNPHVELAEEAEKQGIATALFPCRGRFDPRAILAIRRYLTGNGVRILHTHGYKSNLYGLLATAHTRVGRVTTCHNWTKADRNLSLYAWLDRKCLRLFDEIITVSDDLRSELSGLGVSPDKTVTIRNGITVERFERSTPDAELRVELGLPVDARAIAVVGRLSEEKGHEFFLRAAAEFAPRFPRVYFLLVGDGPTRSRLQQQCHALGIKSRVIFAGTRRDVGRIYALAECLVIPSSREGLPMVLLEAMAARTPVVATTVGAIPDVVDHGVDGLLVPSGGLQELVDAMQSVLQNRDRARSMADRAHQKVQELFSSGAMARQYSRIYHRLVHRAHAPVGLARS